MRVLIPFLFLFVIISSCSKKEVRTFSITGTITPTSVDYLILQREKDIERKIIDIIDTLKVDGQGIFQFSYTGEPYLYSLKLPNKKSIGLALDKNQDIHIEIESYDTKKMKVSISGSKDAEELLAYENFRTESLDRLVASVRREIKALKNADNVDTKRIAELGQLELSNYDKHLDELNDFIKNNMSSTIGLYATSLRWKGAQNLAFFDSLASNFETKHPALEVSKKIREKVIRLQQTEVGGRAVDIQLPNIDGLQENLASINSKFILIDFWASWCGPCRRESAGLNEIYNKYSRNDFDIYGVSLDDKKQNWMDATQKDNRIWINTSSLERFKTPAAYDYAVTALPDNYLIDSERKIIAKNIHGEELETLIKKLLNHN